MAAQDNLSSNQFIPHFTGSHFSDDKGNYFSVQDVVAHAQSNPSYFHKNFPLNKLAHDRAYWQGDKERMNKADTSFPLLVIKDGNNLSVADGLNRMEKAITVEGKKTLDVHIVPKKDIMHLAKKNKPPRNTGKTT